MARRNSMTPEQLEKACNLYGEWFSKFPNISNPTDLNRIEKFLWFKGRKFSDLRLMQQARKQHTKIKGWPCPWTKVEFWLSDSPVDAKISSGIKNQSPSIAARG